MRVTGRSTKMIHASPRDVYTVETRRVYQAQYALYPFIAGLTWYGAMVIVSRFQNVPEQGLNHTQQMCTLTAD